MSYTTTFGIDVSKKCFVYKDKSPDENWLIGNLSVDSLKNIGVTYEEKWGATYASQVRDEYEKTVGGIVNTAKKFVKALQGLANGESVGDAISENVSNSEKSQSLQSLVLEFGTALATAQNTMGQNGNAQLSELMNTSFSFPAYNIPTRSDIPGITLDWGNSLVLNFDFGAAGMFNAKKEVYDPIKNIMESLQSNISVSGNMVTASSAGIPWEEGGFMAKADVASKMLNSSEASLSTLTDKIKNLSSATTKYSKAASKVIDAKMKLNKFYTEAEVTKSGDYVKDNYTTENEDGFKVFGLIETSLGATRTVNSSALTAMSNLHYEDNASGKTDYHQGEYSSYLKTEGANRFNKLVNDAESAYTAAEGDLKADDIWGSLSYIAKIEPNLISEVLTSRKDSVEGSNWNICLGCYNTDASNIYYSIDDIKKDIEDKKIKYSLKLSGIPEKIQASFDFSDRDQNGYPKHGKIAIKKLYLTNPYSTFSNTFSRD